MHGKIYELIESMEGIIERYPLDELRKLGLELRKHSEKNGLTPIEEIVLRRVGGMILEAQRVRQKHLKFVDCYMYGYEAYQKGSNYMDELNYRIKTLMVVGQGAFGSKQKGSRIRRSLRDSKSLTPYFDYMTRKNPSNLGKEEFKYLAKSGYVIATDEHMIATFLEPYCKKKTIAKAKKILAEHGYSV
jgi:hypothetical protein